MSSLPTDDPTHPDLEARSERFEEGGVAHFAARCADLEEFIVSFQAFVDDDTLVLPHHPLLTVGGEHEFVIRLRGAGAVVLRGRCRGLELLSDARSFRRANRAMRVRVLEIDGAFRGVHDRLRVKRAFLGQAEDPRLARLQMLLQVVAPPPRPRDPLVVPPIPPPVLVERLAVVPPPSVTRLSALLPVLEFEPPPPQTDQPLLRPRTLRGRLTAAFLAALRRQVTGLQPVLRRHARIILVGAVSFALGLAARGRPRAEPRPPPPRPLAPVTEAQRPAPIAPPTVCDPEPVVRVPPVHIPPSIPRRPHRRR
jgi:hypothetical protein